MKQYIGIVLMLAGLAIGLKYIALAPVSIAMKDGWGMGIWAMAAGIFLVGCFVFFLNAKDL